MRSSRSLDYLAPLLSSFLDSADIPSDCACARGHAHGCPHARVVPDHQLSCDEWGIVLRFAEIVTRKTTPAGETYAERLRRGQPSLCLTRPALAAVRALRGAARVSLWHPDDLIHDAERRSGIHVLTQMAANEQGQREWGQELVLADEGQRPLYEQILAAEAEALAEAARLHARHEATRRRRGGARRLPVVLGPGRQLYLWEVPPAKRPLHRRARSTHAETDAVLPFVGA